MTYTDIMEGDLSIINSMREAKEKQLERKNAALRRSMPKEAVTPIAPVAEDRPQGFLNPISNI